MKKRDSSEAAKTLTSVSISRIFNCPTILRPKGSHTQKLPSLATRRRSAGYFSEALQRLDDPQDHYRVIFERRCTLRRCVGAPSSKSMSMEGFPLFFTCQPSRIRMYQGGDVIVGPPQPGTDSPLLSSISRPSMPVYVMTGNAKRHPRRCCGTSSKSWMFGQRPSGLLGTARLDLSIRGP